MKSFIGLALMAVLCSVELSQAAAPTTNILKVTDRNHLKKEDRNTEFICEFTTTEVVNKVGIYKKGVGLPIIDVTSTGTTFYKIDGKITSATYDVTNLDFHKAMFSVKKADAPVLEGNYYCKVTIDVDYSSRDVTVYSESEIATFAVAVKDALKDRPTEFKTGGQLDGTCVYEIPVGETITKLEILRGDDVIAAGDKNLIFNYPRLNDFPEGTVRAMSDAPNHKVNFTVVKLTDKSAGDFRCRYTVDDASIPKITKSIVSNGIVLTHTDVLPTIISDVMLTIADNNHDKKEDRETVFACTFTKIKDVTNIVVNVVKIDETPAITLFTVDATGSKFSQVPDKIMSAEFDYRNKDGQKTTFTLKKASAPAPNGVYRCDVYQIGGATVSSKTVKVYTNSELIAFNVSLYGADRDHKTGFGAQLHGSCAYDIPIGETIKKLEVSSDGRDFISGVYDKDMFTFTYNKLDGFTDLRAKEEDKKVTFTAIRVADMSAAKFRCNYDVVDESEYKIKKFIYSNEIELKDKA